jgi:hypothetical protein
MSAAGAPSNVERFVETLVPMGAQVREAARRARAGVEDPMQVLSFTGFY